MVVVVVIWVSTVQTTVTTVLPVSYIIISLDVFWRKGAQGRRNTSTSYGTQYQPKTYRLDDEFPEAHYDV